MSKNPYDVLGVSKSATGAEIKKAFRKQAKEHHPDKGGDEAKFKEINQAYETLGDKQKRSQYDQFGTTGNNAGGGFGGFGGGQNMGGMGGFEDIFSNFFGGGGQSQGQRPQKQRGGDLETSIDLTFEESMNGVNKKFTSKIYVSCEDCDAQGGFDSETCSQCSGQGSVAQHINTPFGRVAQRVTCPKCNGEGKTFKKECTTCHGEGRHEKKSTIEVKIPAGVEDGQTLRVRGKGEAGRKGAPSGDVYLHVHVKPSKKFKRDGLNIHSILHISVFEALLGKQVEIETFWGKVDLTIPENTRDEQMFRLKGKGVHTDNYKGDHIITTEYIMPKKISSKLKKTLEEAQKQM